jgi:inosine triphosphate pyrophosphatase
MKEVDHILNEYAQQQKTHHHFNTNMTTMTATLIGVKLHALKVDLPEIQEVDTMAIAKNKALLAGQLANMPCLVEDTSLHFHALGGMPGPYIKWFQDTLRSEGLYKILAAYDNKQATAVCTLAFSPAPHTDPILFTGECHGTIVPPEPGRGFGWDSIFVPNELCNPKNDDDFDHYDSTNNVTSSTHQQKLQQQQQLTFSQMTIKEKNVLSHRGKAVRKFAMWLEQNQDTVYRRQNGERYLGHQGFKFSATSETISQYRRNPTSAEDSSPMIKAFPNEEYK